MKTFLEFISEAEIVENNQQEFAELRAKIKMLQSRGRPGDAEEIKKLTQQAAELQMGTQAKIGATLNKDKPKKPTNRNSITGGGYASNPADTKGTSGSLPNVGTPSDSQERISGRYADTSSRSQGGGRVVNRNRGQGYSGPESSHSSR